MSGPAKAELPIRPATTAERDRARIKAGADAVDAADLGQLLAALGLDNPTEIAAQLKHTTPNGDTR